MVAAVSTAIWILFGAVLLACAALLGRMVLLLFKQLKDLKDEAANATERLNAAMSEVNALLEQVTEGMSKVQMPRIGDR